MVSFRFSWLYLSHITQSTFLDAPWDKTVQEHVLALRQHLESETKRLEVSEIVTSFFIIKLL